MKIYFFKYALTTGIKEMEVEVEKSRTTEKSYFKEDGVISYEGVDWAFTKSEAIFKAEIMRNKKLESLHRQIEKLNKLTFK